MPRFDPLANFFIYKMNGIYALANIRGGGCVPIVTKIAKTVAFHFLGNSVRNGTNRE